MSELKKFLRYLIGATVLQCAAIFIFDYIFTRRINAIANGLRDSLYTANVASEQVDKVNQAFASISSDLGWVFSIAIALTALGFGVLSRAISKRWREHLSKVAHEE
ncbi:MAG TPA: hypothetical protein VGQ72_10205 [Pyrinomonadaceae bacterium]|jgi:hypothetical protein|nr:hypothetical protein [Pyrinomonadaceae bacterium]